MPCEKSGERTGAQDAGAAFVGDATHEAVAIEVERAISGHGVVRVLDRLALTRGLPQVIRADSGKEFCGRAMVAWARVRGVQLRLIQPGKPNQNAYIDSVSQAFYPSAQVPALGLRWV